MSVTITGAITEPGQPETGFMLDPETGSYSQWGAGLEVLGRRVEYMDAMIAGLTDESDYFQQPEEQPEAPDLGPDTEYGQKRQSLAEFMLYMATWVPWERATEELQDTYLDHAHDTLMTMPHMFGTMERARLADHFPNLAA